MGVLSITPFCREQAKHFHCQLSCREHNDLEMSDVLFSSTRTIAMGTCHWRRDNEKDKLHSPGSSRSRFYQQRTCHLLQLIDGTSLVLNMNSDDRTFSQLAASALTKILVVGARSQRIDVVFEVYRVDSIKHAERTNRGCNTGIQFLSQTWTAMTRCSPNWQTQHWLKDLHL